MRVLSRALAPVRRDSDRGAAAVEFAIVLPLLIILIFGMIQFGILFAQGLGLANAVRQGARKGVVQYETDLNNSGQVIATNCGTIVSQVQGAVSGVLNVTSAQVQVQVQYLPAGTAINNASTVCDWTTSTSSTVRPCVAPSGSSGTGDSLIVRAKYVTHLAIPLVIVNPAFTLQNHGVFECEYHS